MSLNHIIARAKARYGLDITIEDVREIKRLIIHRLPGTRLVKKCEVTKAERWRVEFRGKKLRVLFDPVLERVLTLLPLSDTASLTWNLGKIVGGKARLLGSGLFKEGA